MHGFVVGATASRPFNPFRTNRRALREQVAVASRPCGHPDLRVGWIRGSPCPLESKQHAQRFACLIGRIPCARTGALTREDRRGYAALLAWVFVAARSGTRHRADPCKTGLIKAVRRATGIQKHTQRFTCRIGRIPCARTGGGTAERIAVASRPHWLGSSWCLVQGRHHRADPCITGRIEAARHATGIQQHAQRVARRIGRIPCARTGALTREDRRGSRPNNLELCGGAVRGSP
jgi:hypothetical protein